MLWDGSQWNIVPSPNVSSYSFLYGVAAVSTNDVWAVGRIGPGPSQPLAEHWDGAAWSVIPTPSASTYDYFLGVSAVSANDVWAVGYNDISNATYRTFVEHWDGSQWSIVPSPNPGSYDLSYGISAVSANDVWVVGQYQNSPGPDQTLVEHWDGTSWSVVPSPSPGSGFNFLLSVEGTSANDVWAVGEYNNTGGPDQTLVEHWNGNSWSVVSSPNVGTYGNYLYGVAGVSANDVWVVGYYSTSSGGGNQTLIERYLPLCAITSTPTSSPTRTPSPIIMGHVTWQGRPPQPAALQELPITLTLKSAAGETDYPIQNTDASGFFTDSVTGLPNGLYLWRVDGPKYLASSGTVAMTGAWTTSVEAGLMRAGDCNDDNVVNAMDFTILKTTFGKGNGQPGYDDRADFTGDMVVNSLDFTLLKGNFGQAGAPPIGP